MEVRFTLKGHSNEIVFTPIITLEGNFYLLGVDENNQEVRIPIKKNESNFFCTAITNKDEKSVPTEIPRGVNGPYILPFTPDPIPVNGENIVAISQEDIENIKNQYFVKGRSF